MFKKNLHFTGSETRHYQELTFNLQDFKAEILTFNIDNCIKSDVVEFNKALGNPENSLLAVKKVFEAEEVSESSDERLTDSNASWDSD